MFFFFIKIFLFVNIENKKNPIATIKNLNANAEKGSLLSIIGLVVINADDQSNIKINGKTLIIYFYLRFNLKYLKLLNYLDCFLCTKVHNSHTYAIKN